MTACPDRTMLLHALLDDELDAVNAAACEAHLRDCAGCAAELDRLRAVRTTLEDPALRYTAPAALRASIDAALPANDDPARPPSRFAWASLGAGMAAAAALLLTVALPHPQASDGDIARQLVSGHVRSLLANHLVDVVTSDQHVVKPWFNGRIDFSPATPDLKAQGFPLVGGRLDYIGGRVVPAIVYHRRLHTINLFAWPIGGPVPTANTAPDGYHLRHWQQGGLDYWAVSDIGDGDLAAFEQAFKAAH
jgi:anti-sigma factor RsiW